jgi:NAD-dependent deacetylase
VSTPLARYDRIVFFTGAGMSVESGVPTYRGAGGIWSDYRWQEYACQSAFERDPEKVWDFHDRRRAAVAACRPHAGHAALARLQANRPGITIVTQNIDGMHQRAGARDVLELHGSMWRLRCSQCDARSEDDQVPLLPRRHRCGGYWRPEIVWFGDALDFEVVDTALEAIRTCQLLVSVGTSGVVFPAADFPLEARNNGAWLIEVNPEPTRLSEAYDEHLRGVASQVLAQLLKEETQ